MNTDGAIMTRPAGRPREFDINDALDKAITVFSEQGYHGTSIADLRDAMGLTAGSLYKAFKDKHAIFLASFDRYKQVRNALLDEELAKASDGRDGVYRMLAFYAEGAHGEAGRRGCLAVGTAVELAIFDDEAAVRVGRSMDRFEHIFEALIRRGQEDGSVSRSIDAGGTARLLLSIVQGLRVLGKTSPNREQTFSVVDVAMKLLD
ncbi:TetR/AcrR family transcriptional regulator [Neorhizobium sp. NCHU2750]|uniref:TetR/AcrR family transcriptional regulator n=1 Tax=Neorhizobium sp. NCHU2750 TaxID=1825976 RepID=UPI000E736B38|nr:TetR family transcriptional regulator [Neorhizobium sp. NCHU2750]